MAIIKSFAPFQNLTNFEVFEVDNSPNSEYFRITELNETLTGGKNAFLIEGSEHLKETTEVKIEILDVNGNPIYFEPGKGTPDYYEGNSTLVSMHVYDDTPIGIGKITILGELKTFVGEDTITDVPLDWQGIYNVKWERDILINKTLANETIVRFYKRPKITISEIVKPIFSKIINDSETTGSINGFPLQPPLGQRLSEWRAGTNYLIQRTSGTFDADVDENIITITSGSSDTIVHTANVIEVLSETDLIIDSPYVDSNGDVTNFSSFTGSIAYQDITNETTGETTITGSFAKIDITQLKTFVGDVARVKIFRKSRNAVGDFAFVQEARLESQELLRDVTTAADTEVFFGKFTDDILSNYWISSSNDHPTTVNSSVLSRAAKIDYDGGAGGTQQLITSQSITISKDVEYTLKFKTLVSGSVDTDKSIRAFLSSSDFTQDFLTVSGSGIFQSKQDIEQNIIAENSGSAKLVFEVTGDDWYISNVSLRNAQDTSFSPDEFTIIQDIPRKTATETFDFRFEFYDVNNNFIPVNVTATKEFDGGNDFPTSGKLFTFESDRNAFRFSSGSIGNPPFQQIQFKTSQQNLTGSVTYASAAFDVDGTYINPSSYTGTYPGTLTSVTPAGSIITIANFSGSDNTVTVGSIVYTASLGDLEEFETVYRLEDGDNAPQLVVTSDANQFIYEPTTLSPKPDSQSITVRAQRKNLASLVTPITINSGSNKPGLTYVDTSNGIDTYTISATAFSESFASNDFDSVTYQFTGSDVFGNEQSDEITLSKVINFDAVSIILTNEATSFQAKSTGEILGGLVPSSGSVQMFIGKNQISHDDESGGRNKNTFNITSSVGDNVTPTDTTPNTADYSISAFETAKDSGSLTLTIDYLAGDNTTTQSFEKVVSYTKAKKAVPTVLTKVSPSTQTINSSSLGYETPQTMEVIIQEGGDEYTFDGSLSGGGDSNAQKFNITGLFVDSGSISNSNEILTFGSLTSSFNSIIGSASLAYVDSEGTYVTDKKVRFDLSVSKIGVDGVNGASGSNAKAVSLSSDKYAIVYDGDGNLHPSNQNFTLSGSAQNFNTPEFQFLSGGAVIHDFATTSEVVISSSGYPSAGTSIIYEVRTREQGGSYEGVFDNIDVFAVQSGSDAFTVFLTNEAHVFTATSESVVTSDLEGGAFEVVFFRGAEQYNFGTSGKSYSVSATSSSIELAQSTNSNQRRFTPTSVSGDSGSASLTITDNNTSLTFDKQYSFSLSKEGLVGERGADGVNGASGSDAKVVSLTSTKYAVVYDGDGNLFPANQNFNLSGSAQGFSNPEFQFLSGSDVLHDFASTSEVTISSSGYPLAGGATLYEVRVRENGDAYDGVFDNIDVFGVQSGSDAFTTFLTNEAQVFSANSDGTVTSTFSDGNFETRFFRGSTQFTYDGSSPYDDNSYRLANVTSTNITASQSTNSNQRLFTITGINSGSDNGTITLDLLDNNTGTTFEKTYTFSKSKKGVPVTTLSTSPQAQSVTSGSGGIGTPSSVTLTVNEGGSDYTYTTGTVTANKFKITGVTNGTNNNDGTVTPTTPTNSTAIEGGVTASYTNSEGTEFTGKTIPFSVGVTGLGDPGAAGASGKRTASGMVHYQVSSSSAPSTPSASSYTFSNNTFTGLTSNWGTGAPIYSGSNSAKYWFSTFTVEETTAGGGTGTPSFGSPSQAIGFTGLVSFTATDTIGDGSSNLSFGVAGSTLINGDNISTGRILSTNYVSGSGDGFTNTGTEFSLDEGLLASKNFTVKPDGSALFKGDLTGASGTFSGTVQVGGTTLTTGNTLNSNTTSGDVGLGNVQNLDAQNQAQTGLIAGTTITGGGITLSSGGNIKGGQTAFNTGTGFFLGYTGGAYKFSIGSSSKNLAWDGSNLILTGSVFAENGTFSGQLAAAEISSSLFSVTQNGLMTATNATISGSISANDGVIGGWGIGASEIFSPETGQKRMSLTGGSSPSLTVLSGSGAPSVVISSGDTLSDLGAGSTSVAGSSISTQTTKNVSGTSSNLVGTISDSWLAGPTSGLYISSVDTGLYTINVTIQVPSGASNALATTQVSSLDVGSNSGTAISVYRARAGVYMSTSNTPYSTYAAMVAGAQWNTEFIYNNTQFGGYNFGTDYLLPAGHSGTETRALNPVVWDNTNSGATYYFHTYLRDFQFTAGWTGQDIVGLDADLKTPTLSTSHVSISGTTSRTEIGGGGMQVVSTTSNFVKMQRYNSSQAASVVMLDVGGSIEATGNITANASDLRLKDIKGLITNPLHKLKQLNGIVFNWNDLAKQLANHDTNVDHVGLIAQDVEKVLPEVIRQSPIGKNEGEDYKTIWYDKLVPLLVEAIKELSDKVDRLEEQNKRLEDGDKK